MKDETLILRDGKDEQPTSLLRETAMMDGVGEVISIRAAKAQLSALLDWVARGHEVTITSDGVPKARLVKAGPVKPRRVFKGMGEFLKDRAVQTEGPSAEELVRADRDGRGW
jgi:prevent-host-death family protein